MKRITVSLFVLIAAGAVGRTAPADTAPSSLAEIFKPGIVFQDKNGDGVVDFVDARIALPDAPSAGELAAAANIAARLGYETTAMNLPVRLKPDTTDAVSPTFFVGAKSLTAANVTLDAIGATGLKAGDGVVVAFTVSGKPAIAVLGGDDDGVNAAAVMLAGHLPLVWDQKGPAIDKVADDAKEFLGGKGVNVSSAAASAIYVRHNLDGAERVVVTLQMPNGGDLVKALVALNQFKATTSRDPKRALSYANVGSVQVRLRAPGSGGAFVDIPRVAPAEAATASAPPPARRPGGGAKENFDLSTFYANEGALADSDNNLIPDRVDVLLSAEGDGTSGVVDLAARLGLESTGVSLPIVKPAKAITSPDGEPILVLIGTSHPIVDQLIKNKKFEAPALRPGEGLIQLVRKAFGEKSALVVTGGDAAGVDRAVQQLAQKLPHIWQRGKDRTTLDEAAYARRARSEGLEEAAGRQRRSAPERAAGAAASTRRDGARGIDQSRRRREGDDGHAAVRVQAGLQLALRHRPSRAGRQAGRRDQDQVRRDRS